MAGGCCALPARTRHAREDDRKAQQSFTQHYTTTPAGLRSEPRSKSVRRADRGTAQAAPAYSSGVRRLREHTHAHTPVPSGSQISTRPPRTPARLRFFLTGLVPGNAVSTRPPRGALRLRHRRSGRDGKERPQPCPVCTLERLRVVGSPPAAAPGCVEETAWRRPNVFRVSIQLLLETPPANLCVRWHEVRSRDRGHYFPVARRQNHWHTGEL